MRWPDENVRRRLPLAVAVATLASLAACGDDDRPDARPVVEVFGPIVGDSGARLGAALDEASRNAPVELRYVGVTSFNEQLEHRLALGDRPGVALLPQPGLLRDLTARGVAVPLPERVAIATREDNPPQLVDLVSAGGTPAAVWLTVDIKDLVWFRPAEFGARGLRVPATLDELTELSEEIRTADDAAPWCLTMEAGTSTGWVGTDWVESYVLRLLGAESYTDWTRGDLRFDSSEIREVFERLDSLLRAPGAVAGGQRTVLTVPWERTATMLTSDDPPCLMAHQGDFLRRELPAAVVGPGGDVDFFAMPGTAPASTPLVVGGMLATPLDDTPAVTAAIGLLSEPEVAELLIRTGEFLSPHLDVDPKAIVDHPLSARLVELVQGSTEVQFDGSDLMPTSVGTASFWTGMQAFFRNEQLDVVLPTIDAGWPTDPDAADPSTG